MPSLSHESRLFGIDLSSFGRDLRAGWQALLRTRACAWLTPAQPVRLLRADGSERWLDGQTFKPTAPRRVGNVASASYATAVELPEDQVLQRHLRVPAMAEAELADAVALDVASASPFPRDDLTWGHRSTVAADGRRQVDIALASRSGAQRCLYSVAQTLGAPGLDDPAAVEVWAVASDDAAPPMQLRGFGEPRRAARALAGRRRRLLLLLLIALLLLAVLLTPTVQLNWRALQAEDAYARLAQSAAPMVAKRAGLVAASDRLTTLRDVFFDHVDPLRVLDRLTQVIPDDTALTSLQLDGLKVRISGQATNAAALMQTLGAQPGLRDVKAPTPATRYPGSPKENFDIEFALEADAFRPPPSVNVAAAAPAQAPAAPAAPAQTAGGGSPFVVGGTASP